MYKLSKATRKPARENWVVHAPAQKSLGDCRFSFRLGLISQGKIFTRSVGSSNINEVNCARGYTYCIYTQCRVWCFCPQLRQDWTSAVRGNLCMRIEHSAETLSVSVVVKHAFALNCDFFMPGTFSRYLSSSSSACLSTYLWKQTVESTSAWDDTGFIGAYAAI